MYKSLEFFHFQIRMIFLIEWLTNLAWKLWLLLISVSCPKHRFVTLHPLEQCKVFKLVTVGHYLATNVVDLVSSVSKPRSDPHLYQKAKLSVKPIIVRLIYDLDVALIFKLFQLFSLHPHQCCAFMSIEVNENRF